MLLDPAQPVGPALRDAVGEAITAFLAGQRPLLAGMGEELLPTWDLARQFTAGGKRLRPAFCLWGHRAVAPEPVDAGALVRAAASLDLLHVSALVHDDVMDASDTRRGLPAAHRQYEAAFRGRGDAQAHGRAGAILLGDLLLMWSAELYETSGLAPEALAAARPLLQAVRTEVTCGQVLDVVAQSQSPADRGAVDQATRVLEYKSARYTVVRPVQIGAALAGAPPATLDGLAAFGSPLGRAFQLRDDLLGVYGDEAATGKPAGDDLREGKRTILVAHAFAAATPSQRTVLDDVFGRSDLDEEGVARLREVIDATGAVAEVEARIESGLAEALAALGTVDITPEGRAGLTALAHAAVNREA